MKSIDIEPMKKRVAAFEKLQERYDETGFALRALTEKTPGDSHSPFTGDTRDSRQIVSMNLRFTAKRGGGNPVSAEIHDLFVEGYQLERFLRERLEEQRANLLKQMEAL